MKPTVEILVPFLLPESKITYELINSLLKKKALPSLRNILSNGNLLRIDQSHSESFACAHENYLIDELGFPETKDGKIAPFLFLNDLMESGSMSNLAIFNNQVTPEKLKRVTERLFLHETYCACIEICKMKPSLNGVTLFVNEDNMNLNKLYKLAVPLLSTQDLDVIKIKPQRWFIFTKKKERNHPSFDALSNLKSGSLLRANGLHFQSFLPVENYKNNQNNKKHNVFYQKKSKWWLKLLNDITMAWQKNELIEKNHHLIQMDIPWLYGAGPLILPKIPNKDKNNAKKITNIFSQQELTRGLAIANCIPHYPVYSNWLFIEKIIQNTGTHFIEVDSILKIKNKFDAIKWESAVKELENQLLKPLLFALRTGKLSSLTLTMTSTTNTIKFTINRWQSIRLWPKKKINFINDLDTMLKSEKFS